MPLRLKLLVVVHVLLSVLGIAQFRLMTGILWMPIGTAIASITLAQSMLIGFWIGLGSSRPRYRLLGWLAAAAYLAIWPALAFPGVPPGGTADTSFLNGFIPAAILYAVSIAVFASIYFIIRWRFATLQRNIVPVQAPIPVQFSILHLLVITSLASLVLASSRAALRSDVNSVWHTAAVYTLVISSFIITVVAVPWAVLRPGPVWRRTLLVLVCSLAAGSAISFVLYERIIVRQPWHWWLVFVGQAVAFGLVPALMLVVSLAIVRWCGYRLVSKRRATVAAEPLQFTPAPLNSRTANEG